MLYQMTIAATHNDKPERCWFQAEAPDGETEAAAGDLLGQFWKSVAEKGWCLYTVKTLEVKGQISTGEWIDDRGVTVKVKEGFLAKCVPGHRHFQSEPKVNMRPGEAFESFLSSIHKKPGEEKHERCAVCGDKYDVDHPGSCKYTHALYLRIQMLEKRIEAQDKRIEELELAGQTPSDADALLTA
ncbi:MAG TPA: hypothetical protein VNX28_14785 [Gemmataceae bacterium]|jgi:hypothetical protein|nr:hypothetical protein [Gemmataceae bacterium]